MTEIRINVVVQLPDDPKGTAAPGKAVFLAWEAFTNAIKDTDVTVNELLVGPAKQRRRRRKGKLQVVEPPSAA